MIPTTVQFITAMKLRELHRQRDQLRAAYRGLRQALPDGAGRLRALYDGLRGIKFADQPLHPETVNLEVALHELDAGTLAPEVAALWLRRLEDELAGGEARAEFVFAFGALLEEWARSGAANPVLRAQAETEGRRLLDFAFTAATPTRPAAVLAGPEEAMSEVRDAVAEKRPDLLAHLSAFGPLSSLSRDIYQSPRLRQEAKKFHDSPELRQELTDALTIFKADLDAWDWPTDGVAVRPLWTRNKWRLFLDLDLPTACVLEAVGFGWAGLFEEVFGHAKRIDIICVRYHKLLELNAPQVILDNERRMLEKARRTNVLDLPDMPWLGVDDPLSPMEGLAELQPGSVWQQRRTAREEIQSFHVRGDYGGEYGGGENQAIAFLHAEVQLARAAFPDRPLYVVKLDLQDYYPSLPHDVIVAVLEHVGVGEADRALIRRFLSPPLLPAKQRATRGVPMGFALSGALAELVLRFLDRHVRRRANVEIVRLVDDIALLCARPEDAVAGWRAVEEFCAACGLEVNRAKSGAVCLGGSLPDGLPTEPPRWGMLELTAAGDWRVHAATFDAHLRQTRERVAAAGSVFAMVQQYNANVRFLVGALALNGDLGAAHRESTWQAVRAFHGAFFGPDKGIVAGLTELMQQRLGVDRTTIPDAWVYWPLTAGGLGLLNPLVTAAQFAESWRTRERPQPPDEREVVWDQVANEWGEYYRGLMEPLAEAEPEETKVMAALVADFIQRGKQISGGQQEGLSAYWRWVLYTYGPQILQRFGTFRFLITELVPMRLIDEQRLRDGSLDGGDGVN